VGHAYSDDELFAATSPGQSIGADHGPIDLDVASYIDSVAPVPLDIAFTEPDQAGEATHTVGATAEFIDAPGWPHPGDMGFALESFETQRGNAIGLGSAPADDSAYAPDATPAPDLMAGGDHDLFDPARGWTDYAVASDDVPDAPPAAWTEDAAVETPVAAGAVCADESPGWDAHAWKETAEDATVREAWRDPDWSWDDEDERAGFAAAEEASQAAAPLGDVALVETLADWTPPVVEDAPTVTDPPDELAVTDAPIAQTAPPPADPDPSPALATSIVPPASPATTKRGKHTKRLEKRLATAEDELRRIAKRTKSNGDLRKAGKKKIAKQVRKALADPELAHHFEVRVGKGRLAFERRTHELPILTVSGAAVSPMAGASQGADLLAALQEPLRASLLAGLLADYAHAEAERRVAEVLKQHAGPRHAPDDFDALVTRLAAVTQGPLLGIDAPPHIRR
jgi:hypothetical protein